MYVYTTVLLVGLIPSQRGSPTITNNKRRALCGKRSFTGDSEFIGGMETMADLIPQQEPRAK